ncbi:MAG TPA: HAMP domain-containing sensor histidine kinase [Myxococcaceae bacterium]|nr:HAMP domain-containing sensor histidine kinase [Myxococcaceae bacterium]
MASALPFRFSRLKTKWTATILALLVLVALFQVAESHRIALYGVDVAGREWLKTITRRAPTYNAQMSRGLRGQASLIVQVPQVLAAFEQANPRALERQLSSLAQPGRQSFWVAISSGGTLLGTDAPDCAPAAEKLLPRAELELSRGTFLLCGDVPAFAVAQPVGGDVRLGWVVLGEVLGEAFVDDLAELVGSEVVLWGPKGVVASTFRDKAGRRLSPGLDASALDVLSGTPRDYFGEHRLTLAGYRGYTSASRAPVAADASPLSSLVRIEPLGSGAAELPVRLILAVPTEVLAAGARYNLLFMLAGAVIALIFFGLLASWLVASYARPLGELARASEQVASGDLGVQVPEGRDDELGRLAASFNMMVAGLKRNQANMIQSAKMAAVTQLAAGMAHELNNPLGVILGFAQGLERRFRDDDPAARFPLQSIIRETLRCKELVQNLLSFARAGVLSVERIDVNGLIAQTLPLLEGRAKVQGVRLELRLAAEAPRLLGAKPQLQQVLINVATNALDAMPGGGTLTVRCEPLGPQGARIEVADTGVGIPEEIRGRIFEPFFTTKPVGQGTGLGLSVAYEIVSRHRGNIEVESRTGEGTIMVISLPGEGAAPEATA